MKILLKGIYFLFFFILLVYVLIPSPKFPSPPPGAVQSMEDGDTETLLRRAYFTDYQRQEVLAYYQNQFSKSTFLNIPFISFRLNYPPEEAQTIIRDQTRSVFLEEIVHPLRESFFVNGFQPKVAKDDIWYKGVHYNTKVTVKYKESSVVIRVIVVILTFIVSTILFKEIGKTLKFLKKKEK
jgi:hypothetical protein